MRIPPRAFSDSRPPPPREGRRRAAGRRSPRRVRPVRLAAMGRDPISIPEVFTLVPRDDRPDRQRPVPPELLGWRGLQRIPLDRTPPPAPPPPRGLVFARWPDGRVTVDGFP